MTQSSVLSPQSSVLSPHPSVLKKRQGRSTDRPRLLNGNHCQARTQLRRSCGVGMKATVATTTIKPRHPERNAPLVLFFAIDVSTLRLLPSEHTHAAGVGE